MSFVNGMIKAGRFSEFVEAFGKQHSQDQIDKKRWDYWLHKVFDQTYQDYLDSLGMMEETAAPTEEQQVKAVRRSFEILNGFFRAKVGEDGAIQNSGDDSD